MEYRILGQSGLKVSRLSLGTMTFGNNQWGIGGVDQELADQMVSLALDHGVNLFDTANVYALGESEEILGRALKGRRHQAVVATKVRSRMGPGLFDTGLSRKHLYDALHASLRRLGTDYIDLYQLHGFDADVPMEETLRTLHQFVTSGKVRYLGLSNFAAWQIAKAQGLASCHGLERFVSAQMHYSLVNRDVENEVVPAIRDHGMGLIVWSALSGGFLSGKYRAGVARPEARIQDMAQSFPPFDVSAGQRVLEPLDILAVRHRTSIAAVSLAWVADRPGVASVLIGARGLQQLEENLRAEEVRLTPDESRQLGDLTAPAPQYPGWMIASQAQE